ncbi:MAG: T9SS type A sorting domain-containing protein [Ignavibacteriaceae bacterium]|nr:T9SS type A sorting domain-containing protein [Ignavibacteriaceae bacterium]
MNVENGKDYFIKPTNGTISLRLNDDVKNNTVREIVGRMCHLLQDMSVPAHANIYIAPPVDESLERTFIFVSSGRYERLENILLAKGKTQIENKNQNLSSIENTNIVTEYGLSQNYPNPFNPVTIISYQIKEQGLVQLNVYNLLGQEIVTLSNEVQPAGIYEVPFDARNLPSGVYIYSLRVNDFIQNNKMTLMK